MNEPKKKSRWSFGWPLSDLPTKDKVIAELRREVEALKLRQQIRESAEASERLSPDFDRWHKEDQELIEALKAHLGIVEGNWIEARAILRKLLSSFNQVLLYAETQESILEVNKNAVCHFREIPAKILEVLNRTDTTPRLSSPAYTRPFDPEGHPELDDQ